jgi:DNA-binding NtrC family response regulator
VRLVVPPLRVRPDDILYLANLFLEKYSILHHKSVRHLTPESEALLLRHDWPGNVRELQNRLMQAVILCEKDELGPGDLGLLKPSPEAGATDSEPHGLEPQPRVERPGVESGSSRTSEESSGPLESVEQVLKNLRAALVQQIESARNGKAPLAMPLGRWLTADLILEADTAAGGAVRRGAALVGIPESTFRRLLGNASQQAKAGLSPRPSSWESVRKALQGLIRAPDFNGDDLVQLTRRVLVQEVLAQAPENERTGAALLGVSLPTFRRYVASIETAD